MIDIHYIFRWDRFPFILYFVYNIDFMQLILYYIIIANVIIPTKTSVVKLQTFVTAF